MTMGSSDCIGPRGKEYFRQKIQESLRDDRDLLCSLFLRDPLNFFDRTVRRSRLGKHGLSADPATFPDLKEVLAL